jgi:hypothetical protein
MTNTQVRNLSYAKDGVKTGIREWSYLACLLASGAILIPTRVAIG